MLYAKALRITSSVKSEMGVGAICNLQSNDANKVRAGRHLYICSCARAMLGHVFTSEGTGHTSAMKFDASALWVCFVLGFSCIELALLSSVFTSTAMPPPQSAAAYSKRARAHTSPRPCSAALVHADVLPHGVERALPNHRRDVDAVADSGVDAHARGRRSDGGAHPDLVSVDQAHRKEPSQSRGA